MHQVHKNWAIDDQPDNINDPREALSVLFKRLLRDRQIGPEQWGALLDAYLTRHPQVGSDAVQMGRRTNFVQSLMNPHMTWKTFCRGLDMIGAETTVLRLGLYFEALGDTMSTELSFPPVWTESNQEQEDE